MDLTVKCDEDTRAKGLIADSQLAHADLNDVEQSNPHERTKSGQPMTNHHGKRSK